jgi:L-fuculose-phosphate aldolase
MSSNPLQREQIVETARRLAELGLVAGSDGNISVRLDREEVLVTPSGHPFRKLIPESLVAVSLGALARTTGFRPTSELPMHLQIYRARPDIFAVVHTHAPYATAFAAAGRDLDDGVLPELDVVVGRVASVKYATPGSTELADKLAPFLPAHDAFLLANHGLVTIGRSLDEAVARHETVEHSAHILFLAYQLGGPEKLPEPELNRLRELRAGTASDIGRETR